MRALKTTYSHFPFSWELRLIARVCELARLRLLAENRLHEASATIAQELRVPFACDDAGAVYRSLQALPAGDTSRAAEMLLTHAMCPAEYFAVGELATTESLWRHYALNMDRYTHFTSPIRRYADVLVHRQLFAALENQSPPDFSTVSSAAQVRLELAHSSFPVHSMNRNCRVLAALQRATRVRAQGARGLVETLLVSDAQRTSASVARFCAGSRAG